MSNMGHRARVERLLRGEFTPYDLSKLFLFLRLQPHCGAVVSEIGNFESHSSERSQGISTTATEEFFAFIRFRWPYIAGKAIPLDNLPPIFPDAIRGNFKRIDDRYIKKKTHLKRSAAKKAIDAFLGKMVVKQSGNLSVSFPMNPSGWAVIECVMNRVTVHPAFDERDLFREFCDILIRCGLLETKEIKALKNVRRGITLYAVALMHRCTIRLKDESLGQLVAIPDRDGKITVGGSYSVPSATDPGKKSGL